LNQEGREGRETHSKGRGEKTQRVVIRRKEREERHTAREEGKRHTREVIGREEKAARRPW
jgi:hypothetical protein